MINEVCEQDFAKRKALSRQLIQPLGEEITKMTQGIIIIYSTAAMNAKYSMVLEMEFDKV